VFDSPDGPGIEFGFSVSLAGDVDGNGTGEVLIGAPGYDGEAPGEGRAYLFEAACGPTGCARPGEPCATDGECVTRACVEGICCDRRCDGPCWRGCNEAGRCLAAAAGVPCDACGACDGDGACVGACPPDAGPSPDAGRDLDAAPPPERSGTAAPRGCGCRMGASVASPFGIALLTLAAALLRRRSRPPI
jgi:hypothetical protein